MSKPKEDDRPKPLTLAEQLAAQKLRLTDSVPIVKNDPPKPLTLAQQLSLQKEKLSAPKEASKKAEPEECSSKDLHLEMHLSAGQR